jgi:hypothetical protein
MTTAIESAIETIHKNLKNLSLIKLYWLSGLSLGELDRRGELNAEQRASLGQRYGFGFLPSTRD